MSKVLCFFGFHKWKVSRWLIDRGDNRARLCVHVKECQVPFCRAIKKLSTLEYFRLKKKQNT